MCDAIASGPDGLVVEVEDAGATSDKLVALPSDEDPGFDAWLVAGPWAEIGNNREFEDQADVLAEPTDVLGALADGGRGQVRRATS